MLGALVPLVSQEGSDWRAHAQDRPEPILQAGVTQPTNSFSTLFFDYDNDGPPDKATLPTLTTTTRNELWTWKS